MPRDAKPTVSLVRRVGNHVPRLLGAALIFGCLLTALPGCPQGDPPTDQSVQERPSLPDNVPLPSAPPRGPGAWAGPPVDVSGSNGCCVPVGFDDIGTNSGPNDDVIAAVLFRIDSDKDGESDGRELARGSDPYDPTDGDADGDGIENGPDPDVDNDGLPNGADDDIDGDGIKNDDDDDMDGDGLIDADDGDDDGDGVADDEDEDDDADGEDDCECEHGVCSEFKGLCFCDAGWKGEDCDEFTCVDVGNCNNGTCIGPNNCRCDRGWQNGGGRPCTVFNCLERANCNGHGDCTGANTCTCDDDWKGTPDCRQHTCVTVPSRCDDGNACTIDECDAADGCSHEPVLCSLFETCVAGTCVPSCTNTTDCDAGQACQGGGCIDDCDSDTDCRDGDACTSDECGPNSKCVNDPVVCSLFEECVLGKCVEGCINDFDCDFDEFCVSGGCFAECEDDADCDDGETCDSSENACLPADDEDEGGR